MPERVNDDDLELLAELGMEAEPATAAGPSAREQRIIAGFEEVERFFAEHGRPPQHGEQRDIFERLYAVRLDRIRESVECRQVLKDRDTHGLLSAAPLVASDSAIAQPSDEQLLAELGVDASRADDILRLVHVRSQEERKAAEEIARRDRCEDFDAFRPMFEQVQDELASGKRITTKYKDDAEIRKGDLFIVDGQKALVADAGDPFVADFGREDRRLRVVYDNGTQGEVLGRSLMRALNRDKTSRRIIEASTGPLFSDQTDADDLPAGYLYVLRSLSEHRFVAERRELIHKIGVTGGDVKARVLNAKRDPTFLLADVEIVAVYKLANINRRRLEALIHRVFGSARLDMELKDRFGSEVEPREWFLVSLAVVNEVIDRIKDGTIGGFRYDREIARLIRA